VFPCYRQQWRQLPTSAYTHEILWRPIGQLSRGFFRESRLPFLESETEQSSGWGIITSLHLMEQKLGDLPVAHAFLRLAVHRKSCLDVRTARSGGKIFLTYILSIANFSLVATADIGKGRGGCLGPGVEKALGTLSVAGPGQYSPTILHEHFLALST